MDPTTENILLPDGSQVVAKVFLPAVTPRASIVVSAAMGVPQRFYADFAKWLAAQGFAAMTFDYRGIGISAPRSLRTSKATISKWASEDCAAMIDAAKVRVPNAPLFWLGHSLGAQLVGMIPNRHLIDGVIIVSSGSGYWKNTARATKRNSIFMFYFLAPVLTPLFGYFPGKRLRAVGDLPAGVIRQWRRWCLNPEYMIGVEGRSLRRDFAEVRTPMLSISFTDDEMMSITSTEALLHFYASAPIDRQRVSPSDIGARHIGHFGFFREQFATSLWPRVTSWIEQQPAVRLR
jgi:predicted alpha/beta hydrolase